MNIHVAEKRNLVFDAVIQRQFGTADNDIRLKAESLKILDSQLIPLVTHYNYEENIYTVYRLDEYTEELAASHSVHEESDEEFTLSSLKAMAENAINAINASYSID